MNKLDLQPLSGIDVQFNPAVGLIGQGLKYTQTDVAQSIADSGLPQVLQRWYKHLDEQRDTGFRRGQLARESGRAILDSDVPAAQRSGYLAGFEYQTAQQGIQGELARHAKEYREATLRGASDEERTRIYQDAINRIGQGIDEAELSEPYKQQLRKLSLDNLDVMFKAQVEADKVATERKYDEITAGNAVSLKSALTASASAQDPAAASNALYNAFQTQLAAEYIIGNDKHARKVASQRMGHVINTLLQNFDPQDAGQVAARNMLLSTAPSALHSVLDIEEYSKLQDLLYKADNNIRDFNGVQAALQVEQFRRDILGGQFKTTEELQGLIDSTLQAARSGKLSPSDALQRVRNIGDLQELQKRQQAEGKSSLAEMQELTAMTAVQAEALYGSTEKWEKAIVQQALQQFQGDTVKAGWQVFEVGRMNHKDDLTLKGIDMFSRSIQYSLNNHDPESFKNAAGNADAEAAFAVWRQAWSNTVDNRRWDLQDQLSKALGKNSSIAVQVLQENPQASLADIISTVQQWKSVGGFEKQSSIVKAADAMTAEQFLPNRRWTNWDTFGSSPHSLNPFKGVHLFRENTETKQVAELTLSAAKTVLQRKAGQMTLNNQVASNADGAYALLVQSGNVLQNSIGAVVLDDKVKAKLTALTGMQNADTLLADIIKDYQVKLGQGNPEAVFLDGMWNSDKLRFIKFEGTNQVQTFVPYSEFQRAFLDKQEKLAKQPKRNTSTGVLGLNISSAVKELKAMQTKPAAPKAVVPRIPVKAATPQRMQHALSGGATRGVGKQSITQNGVPTGLQSLATGKQTRIRVLQEEIANWRKAIGMAEKGLQANGKPLGNISKAEAIKELNSFIAANEAAIKRER